MAAASRDGSGYEPFRPSRGRFDGMSPLAGIPAAPSPGGHAIERPTLGTPTPSSQQPKATTPGSQSRASFQTSYEHERDPSMDRRSQDRSSLLGNKRRSNVGPGSIKDYPFPDYSADVEREPMPGPSTLERSGTQTNFDANTMGRARSNSAFTSTLAAEAHRDTWRSRGSTSPEPNMSAFVSPNGRPLSIFDLKEQAKKAKAESIVNGVKPSAPPRDSWRSTYNTAAYNYGDMADYAAARYFNAAAAGDGTRPRDRDSELLAIRLPWTMWMNSDFKNHFVAAVGEWAGTTMFLFFAFAGTQVANAKSATPSEATTTNATTGFDPAVMLYISLAFGFSLMVNVWVFFRISGGLFNPAVTLALFATGAIGAWRSVCLFFAQIAGSITASALVLAIFPTPLNVRTTLSDGTSIAQGLFIEAFMTAELVFTILMLAKEKHKATFIAPVGIGLALFIAELCGVYYTGGSLNPARSIGPCIVTNTWDSTHWIYWLGPAIGCAFAIGFYKFIKILEYEMANPGQDGDDLNDPTKNPYHEVREKQREMTAKILSGLNINTSPARQQMMGGDGDRTPQLGDNGFYLPDVRGSVAGGRANVGDLESGFGPGPGPRGDLSTIPSNEMQTPSPGNRADFVASPQRASPRHSLQDIREAA
ncbi:mip family channel protein [Diplodia corticola]|uniref:Mip family channel protein n=1 Tax=Diplodia corticola TaxID=236234 RepID=A0A1J9R3J7_9PEZI|nr:mip family channel protein [Diplodia corticola]OJD35153.1 mip family channel protein [Diplodia corticola]